MKPLVTALLAASLVLNATLAVFLVAGVARQQIANLQVTEAKSAPTPKRQGPVIDETVWPKLGAGDLSSLVAQLRAAGFPPAVVRAIVSAQLQEQFTARRRALDPDADNRPFWKASSLDPKVQLALRQLSLEQQKQLRELLGPDAEPDDPMTRAREARQFGFLPAEKITEAKRIVREFNDLRSEIYMSFGGPIVMTPADREKLAGLDQQMNAELKRMMTPQEFEQYELRSSSTANSLRYQLAAFDATEQEFITLFRLQREHDTRFPPIFTASQSPEESRRRGEAYNQLQQQIKLALGPRAADYERATNHDYRTTSQLVARLELPPETAIRVYDVQKDIMSRSQQAYRAAAGAGDRSAPLANFAAEAETKLTALLGRRGFEAYKQYGGSWLQSLRPPSTAPRPGN